MTLDELPEELIEAVLNLLGASDLLRLSECSRYYSRLALAPRLWYNLLGTSAPFHSGRDYVEAYAWRYGSLAVDVRSNLAPKDDELFKILTFFPLHRSYSSAELAAACSSEYLPWAKADLLDLNHELVILAVRRNSIIAHSYDTTRTDRHALQILRQGHSPVHITGLPDWPLCASFIGDHHVVVCGRFPALLLYDLRREDVLPTSTIPLSSHTINCMSMDDPSIANRFVLAGHYKGRGSIELLTYEFVDDDLSVKVIEKNRFGGITAIVSCACIVGGGIVTYDNFNHIHLWSSIHNTERKMDHDGIGELIPSEMVYKMFYSDRQLIFVDQYKRQTGFIMRLGKEIPQPPQQSADECDVEAKALQDMLSRQSTDMAALARRIIGMS